MLMRFDANIAQIQQDITALSDQEWEKGQSSMGDTWKSKKYEMTWGFLFDAIHHRGQLSTYLREMGASIPAIYGLSADTK